jgi:acyl-[acyl carrier protein]--UDP-N-acetylglucosamine O-acyltransferase
MPIAGSNNSIKLVDSELLRKVINLDSHGLSFSAVGDVYACHCENILSYIKDERFIDLVNQNDSIAGVICVKNVTSKLRAGIIPLVCDDPNWAFFTLMDYLGRSRVYSINSLDSEITESAVSISGCGVTVGKNVLIEPFVTVHRGTKLGDHVIVRSGAVLGLDSFQHQRTSRGLVSPAHDGDLIVGNSVEIGANTTISKGFSYRNTVIGADCKIDAGVYIGHGATIGSRAIICAGAKIMGHSHIGDDVFVGPGAIISNRIAVGRSARVSLGAVVTKNVAEGMIVSGNFAIPHKNFLAALKRDSNYKESNDGHDYFTSQTLI